MRWLPLLGLLSVLGGVLGRRGDNCPNGCSNNGYCVDGVCHCMAGYTSADCSDEGCPSGCSEHGTCMNGQCQCSYGWIGADCASRGCRNNCYNHGVCHIGPSSVNCRCYANYTGLECEHASNTAYQNCEALALPSSAPPLWPFAASSPSALASKANGNDDVSGALGAGAGACSSHGVCLDNRCYCALGYTGVDCSQRICPQQCNGHGVCNTYSGVCLCFQGYSGPGCEEARCPLSCSGRGVCNTTSGVCVCNAGFYGADCSPFNCADPTCAGRGQCIKTKFMPVAACNCTAGWTGNTCQTRMCNPGWAGPNCDQPHCDDDCNGHGTCHVKAAAWPGMSSTAIPGSAPVECHCDHGYAGQACQTRLCIPACANGGTCVEGVCACAGDWLGPACTEPPKPCPTNCSHHGECHWGDCYCEAGFYGDDCGTVRRFTAPTIVGVSVMGCTPTCNPVHGVCVTLNITAPLPLKLSLLFDDMPATAAAVAAAAASSSSPSPSLGGSNLSPSSPAYIAALSLLQAWYKQMRSGVTLQQQQLPAASAPPAPLRAAAAPSSPSATVLLQEAIVDAAAPTPAAAVPTTEFLSTLPFPSSPEALFAPPPPSSESSSEPSVAEAVHRRHMPNRGTSQSTVLSARDESVVLAELQEKAQSKQQQQQRQGEMDAQQQQQQQELDVFKETKLEFAPEFATDIHGEPFLRLTMRSSREGTVSVRDALVPSSDLRASSQQGLASALSLSPSRFLHAILAQLSYITSQSPTSTFTMPKSLSDVDQMQLQTGTGIVNVCYCREGFTGLTCSRRVASSSTGGATFPSAPP